MVTRISKRNVRIAMANMGIGTQRELASMAGLHEQTLTNVLNNGTFQSTTLDKLAEVLGISPSDLIETSYL